MFAFFYNNKATSIGQKFKYKTAGKNYKIIKKTKVKQVFKMLKRTWKEKNAMIKYKKIDNCNHIRCS